MKEDLSVKNGIVIPGFELEITASRSGGAGGQHVNKTDTRITVRWNVPQTRALTEEQKERVLRNLAGRLTLEGDLIVHNSESRSQLQNKRAALMNLAEEVRKALYVPKIRIATRVPRSAKEARLRKKKFRSAIKKMRRQKDHE
jgi:Protein chain release factor B